jgi:hypothetical protein
MLRPSSRAPGTLCTSDSLSRPCRCRRCTPRTPLRYTLGVCTCREHTRVGGVPKPKHACKASSMALEAASVCPRKSSGIARGSNGQAACSMMFCAIAAQYSQSAAKVHTMSSGTVLCAIVVHAHPYPRLCLRARTGGQQSKEGQGPAPRFLHC